MKLICLLVLVLCSVVLKNSGMCNAQGTDLTLIPYASGPDVVRAVLSKIDASGAFGGSSTSPVNAFMRRMAYVESRDGEVSPYPNGGVWNVSPATFHNTQSTYRISSDVFNEIVAYFGLNWTLDIQYANLTKPLYSGLAVRLQLYYLENDPLGFYTVPSKSGQANYWITRILGITPSQSQLINSWNTAVAEIERIEGCRIEADVVFVLDASGSINAMDFDRVRNYAYRFADELIQDVNNHQNRIGVILYSDFATVEIPLDSNLNEFQNKTQLLQRIRDLPQAGGLTNTPDGLCQLADQPWRTEELILQVGIVLTDGESNRESSRDECRNISLAAERAKERSILIYALGVGPGVDEEELQLIASGPHFTDHVDSFTEGLDTSQDVRSYEFCFTTEQHIQVGTSSSGSTPQGQTTRVSIRSPQEEGLTIRICITEGQLVLYVSTSVPNPSAALHDWMATVTAVEQSINCLTEFFTLNEDKRRRRQTDNDATLYLAIEGIETNNEFSFNSSIGNVILDNNECEESPPPCPELMSCYNTDGSFYCQCSPGFHENGSKCIDINECKDMTVCDDNAVCLNSIGSYNCTCSQGFMGNGTNCKDINECKDVTVCDENAVCVNSIGSYNCTCSQGFVGNGTNCEDYNECEDKIKPCQNFEICVNTPGGFSCSVNGGQVTLTVILTVGSVIVLVTAVVVLSITCYGKKHKHQKHAKKSDDSDQNSLAHNNAEDDDNDWGYTMTITWQEQEKKK